MKKNNICIFVSLLLVIILVFSINIPSFALAPTVPLPYLPFVPDDMQGMVGAAGSGLYSSGIKLFGLFSNPQDVAKWIYNQMKAFVASGSSGTVVSDDEVRQAFNPSDLVVNQGSYQLYGSTASNISDFCQYIIDKFNVLLGSVTTFETYSGHSFKSSLDVSYRTTSFSGSYFNDNAVINTPFDGSNLPVSQDFSFTFSNGASIVPVIDYSSSPTIYGYPGVWKFYLPNGSEFVSSVRNPEFYFYTGEVITNFQLYYFPNSIPIYRPSASPNFDVFVGIAYSTILPNGTTDFRHWGVCWSQTDLDSLFGTTVVNDDSYSIYGLGIGNSENAISPVPKPNNNGYLYISPPAPSYADDDYLVNYLLEYMSQYGDEAPVAGDDSFTETVDVPATTGTYPSQEYLDYLDSIGVGVGTGVNWLTRIFEKVNALTEEYSLSVPHGSILGIPLPSFNFDFLNIWHYVVDWVNSLGSGFSLIRQLWSVLPYSMIVPIYATIVIVIVLGVYKRFFM